MLRFQFPELFLLLVPAWFAFRRWGTARGVTGWVRAITLVLLLIALAGPELDVGGRGIDVIVVVDRSRSMPEDANVRELVGILEQNRAAGDRVAVVGFGQKATVEQVLSPDAVLEGFQKRVGADGSDLGEAIHTALTLVDPNRPARILVLSDGESNGPSPLSAARQSRDDGVPIDYRIFERLRTGDTAITAVELPEILVPRERFQFTVRVHSDREVDGRIVVHRNGEEFASRVMHFETGFNDVKFRDVVDDGGLYEYTAEIEVEGDPVTENDRGAGVLRVDAGPRLLVLNGDGLAGRFGASLKAARIPFDVAKATDHPVTQDSLDRYRAVVLENVPARDLGRRKMERLAQFVEDLGGGLMLTGGQRSYGTGGYFQSPLDPLLPVSMELREEHRKTRVAIAVALDRSGSMTAPVKGSMTKMDLANLGTAEVVKLLSPGDSIAVIAVDSTPHVIQPLVNVENKSALVSKIKGIQSMGGGIFVYEALVAAGRELAKAEQATKHIILFSDAADSEQPGAYKVLLEKFAKSGITVSVIGLGTDTDSDAALLKDIATLGSGNIMFSNDAQELPRLFTEDTMSVARSSFVQADPEKQPDGIPGELLPDVELLGRIEVGDLPPVDGYNLGYLRPDATLGAFSKDEYAAPWTAFWFRGLGRVAALTLEVDGPYSGRFRQWPGYDDYLVTHARWLLAGNRPDDVFPELVRRGQEGVMTVELDSQRADPPQLVVVPPGDERTATLEPEFVWVGPNTVEARFRMERAGSYHTLLKTGDREFVRGPAVTLPYSPEFVPRTGELAAGSDVLERVAEISGGTARTEIVEALRNPPRSSRTMSLIPILLAIAIGLLLLEIAGRRLSLWERVAYAAESRAEQTTPADRRGWLPKWMLGRKRERPASTGTTAPSTESSPPPPKPAEERPAAEPESKPADVFAAAKARAKRRNR